MIKLNINARNMSFISFIAENIDSIHYGNKPNKISFKNRLVKHGIISFNYKIA